MRQQLLGLRGVVWIGPERLILAEHSGRRPIRGHDRAARVERLDDCANVDRIGYGPPNREISERRFLHVEREIGIIVRGLIVNRDAGLLGELRRIVRTRVGQKIDPAALHLEHTGRLIRNVAHDDGCVRRLDALPRRICDQRDVVVLHPLFEHVRPVADGLVAESGEIFADRRG